MLKLFSRITITSLLWLVPAFALAETAANMSPNCLPAPCAGVLEDILSSAETQLDNGNWLSWKNGSGAEQDVMRLSSGNDVEINGVDGGSDFIGMYFNKTLHWFFSADGRLVSSASDGGDIVLSGSGQTLHLQEATASTACMGTATPNGTTPVSVTTSCAVTGSRVFYSRAGAVTNMGTITTTTAANGTSFSFASTGASDTLASSVIWLIINEAS